MSSRRVARLELQDGRRLFAELEEGRARLLSAAPWLGGKPTGETLEGVSDEGGGPFARPLAPVTPSKIVCVGRNYPAHARELGNPLPAEPMLFLKPPSSLLDPGGMIELPPPSLAGRVDHEAEIAAVIGRRARRVLATEAASYVFGLTIACDVTARELQKKDGQWTRAKGMDTFCPLGPIVATGLDAAELSIECRVNGELRQEGRGADMIFDLATVIAYVTETITLEPGDLLLTGTPPGVGPLAPDDELEISVPGLGTLRARVIARGP